MTGWRRSDWNRGSALLALVVLWVACVLQASLSGAQETAGYCLPEDFQRDVNECVEGTRKVSYYLDRSTVPDCVDPFAIHPEHSEPCNCTPWEYSRVAGLNGTACQVTYLAEGCDMPIPGNPPQLTYAAGPKAPCNSVLKACTDANLRSVRTKCDAAASANASRGQQGEEEKYVEVIYFFDGACDPYARGSVKMPPRTRMPCDHSCPAGSYLKHDDCAACPPGTFSLGGGTQYAYFDKRDRLIPEVFKSQCTFKNSSGVQNCTGWAVRAGRLQVGPFDPPNILSFVECGEYEKFTCHNSLSASLSTTVELVRDGHVKFSYTVSAELGYDGLNFYVDTMSKPVMGIESEQMQPKEVNFSLESGVHTLTWVYHKDARGSSGQDMATITLLEISGTAYSDLWCTACAPGYYSPGNVSQCLPCPLNTFSKAGAMECEMCSPETYSLLLPRTLCTTRLPCDPAKDASVSFSACKASTKTRWQKWEWAAPHVCAVTAPASIGLPPTVPVACPPCPLGMHYVPGEIEGTTQCDFCPAGTYRNASLSNDCLPCGEGEAALRHLTLTQLLALRDPTANATQLPGGFLTGCSGDCGGTAWRVNHGVLDSGAEHGPSVVVWVSLTVALDRDGVVYTNMSVDIPAGDTQRGAFFHIDDYPVEQIVNDEYDDGVDSAPFTSGPWPLTAGTHRLMWTWIKVHASSDRVERDSAVIYDVTVEGSSSGGAVGCHRVPEGAQQKADKSGWTECPPGQYSIGGTGLCTDCPANTFNDAPMGGPSSCVQCGHATSSKPGSDECVLGDVDVPASFCTYRLQARRGLQPPLMFDLSPLYQAHPGQAYGPIPNDPTSPTKEYDPAFFVSICQRDRTNATCYTYEGDPLNAYACRTGSHSFLEGDRRPGRSVGKSMTVVALAEVDYRLARRGLKMLFQAEGCPDGGNRTLTLAFICDPNAGIGEPEAWTAGGYAAAFDPSADYPQWLNRSGPVVPIDGPQGQCKYNMVWYTASACPVCTAKDVELMVLNGCPNNTLLKQKYKEPRTCQPSALAGGVARDVPCRPCAAVDYEVKTGECKDEAGGQNITYYWRNPKVCNDRLEGAAKLPVGTVAGPCAQVVLLVPSRVWSMKSIISVVLIGVAVVVFALVSLLNWLKTRRIYKQYTQLAQTKGSASEAVEMEEHGGS